ncbi:unnamed protein product [Echinostoma caproni]|uniref:Sepiapterin reductase n=1 Tax=Echinostoma caproni TaxID=27848 RepID=A0A3P8KF25_9TREM|nr:unnamed protein product [Echinostoma caproni]
MIAALQPLFDSAKGDEKQWNLLVHNAGSLGCLTSRADERISLAQLDAYYRTNVTTVMVLTSLFLQHFAPYGVQHAPTMVVNVSSLAAAQPFPYMSDYCTGKAARNMYMECLAVDRPSVAVFNYSPGPLDTDMYTQLILEHGDEKIKAQHAESKRSGQLIDPDESARVCVSWIARFHIDTERGNVPKALVCSVHHSGWSNVWRGPRLDYYDAVAMERR